MINLWVKMSSSFKALKPLWVVSHVRSLILLMYCFIRGRDLRVWPLRTLWACSAQNSQVQPAQHGYQNREICFAWDAAKRRTTLKQIFFSFFFFLSNAMLLCVKPRKKVLAPSQAFTYRGKNVSTGCRSAIEGVIYGMRLWRGYMVYMLYDWVMIALFFKSMVLKVYLFI